MGNTANRLNDPEPDKEKIDSFQRDVTVFLEDLCSAGSDELLSIQWMLKVVNSFSMCLDRFSSIVVDHKRQLANSPMKDILTDNLQMNQKVIEILKSVRDGMHFFRQQTDVWIDTAVYSLSESEFDSAKRLLEKVVASKMLRLDPINACLITSSISSSSRTPTILVTSPTLARSWSATEQLQCIICSLKTPRKKWFRSTNGFAKAVYTMGFLMFHMLWVFVVAFPCQGRTSVDIHFDKKMVQGFTWGESVKSLRKRIMELDTTKAGTPGLKEMHDIDKYSKRIISAIDSPSDDQRSQIVQAATELANATKALKDLDSLDHHVRELDHKIEIYMDKGRTLLSRAARYYNR